MAPTFHLPTTRWSAALAAAAVAGLSALALPAAANAAAPAVSEAAPEVVFMSPEEFRSEYREEFDKAAPADLSTIANTKVPARISTETGEVVDTVSGTTTASSSSIGILATDPGGGSGATPWQQILWQQTDKKGRTIPTRYGNSSLGFDHYASRHNLVTSAPWKVIKNTTNPYKVSGAHIEYQALVVQTSNVSIKMKIRIVAQAATSTDDRKWKTTDGKYIGTITAYCEGVTKCPAWVNALK